MKYTIFRTGYYQVSSIAYVTKKTGVMMYVKNPNCHWYTPWREPLILQEEFFTYEEPSNIPQIRYLKKGETIESEFCVFIR